MTFREFTGKNVEESIRTAMKEFSSDLGDLDIEILSQGSRGLLGVGGEEARILAAPKSAVAAAERAPREPRSDRPAREPAPFVSGKPEEELSDEERSTLDTAQTVLTEMIGLMGLDATVEIARGGDTARLNVKGDDLGALIGRRGEKLASLQHIVNLIVGRREGQHHRIAIDVENYRGRREEQLRDVADRAAKRVIQSGKIIQLEAMPAIERRVVHMALLENPKVRTQSVGVEPNRRIVVLPATQVRE